MRDHEIVIAGAGYGGLHTTLRLASWLAANHKNVGLTLVDQHNYHQILTELPRVAGGGRSADEVRLPLRDLLDRRANFVQAAVEGFDFAARQLHTSAGPISYTRLVLALGSRPNDFGIPGLAERALTLWSVDDAKRVLAAVDAQIAAAVMANSDDERRRLMTVVIGGGGATGVELAGELAEELPHLAKRHDLDPRLCKVILIDAGPSILAGSSPALIARASGILHDLGIVVRTKAPVTQVIAEGVVLKGGEVVAGGIFVWAGGVKAPAVVAGSGLVVGNNGRVKVDPYLRAIEHPEVYVAGDLASVADPQTGRAYPPTAQQALVQGEVVATNLYAELQGRPLEAFSYGDRPFVVSVGGRKGVAAVAGRSFGGRVAHLLKDAIEWEYRHSVTHLQGWTPVA